MANNQVAIVGLGPVSASMGLALRNSGQGLEVTGTDRDWGLATRMQKLGAVDRLERKPAAACKEAGLVVIAEPLSDMVGIFQTIAGVLSPGCVITDVASLKVEVIRWAEEFLPGNVSFIGGHPLILADKVTEPRADLFRDVQYCLVPASNAVEQAVEVVSGLVSLLGAQTYFLDAAEHDGLMAATEGLPRVLQLALLAALSEAGSWRDNQRAASRPFIDATITLEDDATLSAYLCRLNRQNLAHWIDAVQVALAQLKVDLLAEEEDTFNKHVVDLHETRRQWLRNREVGTWDTSAPPPVETSKRDIFTRLFLPEIGRKSDKS